MNKAVRSFVAVLMLMLVSPGLVVAAEGIEFGLKRWLSDGRTHWRHDASFLDSDLGVPSSELDYRGVNSEITEFSIRTDLARGHFIRATFGLGDIDEGFLVDDDYLSASGAVTYGATQSGAQRFSRTYSNISGDGLYYLKGEFGPENLVFSPFFGQFRLSFAAHYWWEEYQARGIEQIEWTLLSPPASSCQGVAVSSSTRVITNTVEWTGLGMNLDGVSYIAPALALKLDLSFYPVMKLVNDDIHHCRGVFAQSPSIRMTGTGMGYDFEIGLDYQIRKNLTANLVYRRWERWVENQTITFYYTSGGVSSAKLMDFSTRRDGLVAGIEFVF